MTRLGFLLAAAAAVALGGCANRVASTVSPTVDATIAPNVEFNIGRGSGPIAPLPPAPIVKRVVVVVPQVPQSWRRCEPAPPLLADDATQDQETVWVLQTRRAGADCRSKLASVDSLLTKAEAGAKRGSR